MISLLQEARDRFLGRGAAAVTVLPMDGALRPNAGLENAVVIARASEPDNLLSCDSALLFSDGGRLLRLDPAGTASRQLHDFGESICAMASGADGSLAIGLTGGAILIGHPDRAAAMRNLAHPGLGCPVAMTFDRQGDLIICQGSASHAPEAWQRDLMERRRNGALWRIAASGGRVERIASDLAFPFGVLAVENGLVVSEAWRHRLVLIGADGGRKVVLDDLPGYPARLTPAQDGYWVCIFAPRSQLIEFVLRERRFCDRMMRDVEPRHWIAPSLEWARSYLDPMQGGGMITHGQLKPWAPTRSYGLVVRLDATMQPVASHHSRADGRFHGITACAELGGNLFIASKGGGAILKLPAGSAGEAA